MVKGAKVGKRSKRLTDFQRRNVDFSSARHTERLFSPWPLGMLAEAPVYPEISAARCKEWAGRAVHEVPRSS